MKIIDTPGSFPKPNVVECEASVYVTKSKHSDPDEAPYPITARGRGANYELARARAIENLAEQLADLLQSERMANKIL